MTADVITADDPNSDLCTISGVTHDFRPHTSTDYANRPHTYLRCVWCHVVTCGDYTDADPCMRPYHHHEPHVTRTGVTWPIGGNP